MRLFTYVYILNIGLITLNYSQDGWYYQNPKTSISELNSVQFVNEDTGWAIGSCGTIIHTTDGGENWKLQIAEDVEHVWDLSFVDGQNGWIIGYKYTGEIVWGYPLTESALFKTENSGNNWEIVPKIDGYNYTPNSVFFINVFKGYVFGSMNDENNGSIILKTVDGGNNWDVQIISNSHIYSPFFLNDSLGWAIGGGSSLNEKKIYKTVDGGKNWTSHYTGVYEQLGSIFFIDENIGWVVGTSNTILKTIDGGSTWFNSCENSNIPLNNQFTSVYFVDHDKGFIAGWDAFLITNDGGDNWTVYEQIFQENYLSIFFINPNVGWRVGTEGSIQKTCDGGDTWEDQRRSFTRDELTHVDFVDDLKGWVISPNSILHTNNGGKTWILQQEVSQPNGSFNYIYSADSLISWVVGYDRNHSSALILKTEDGGKQWNRQQVNYDLSLNCACFIDKDVGWIVGESGFILTTEDGGTNWTQQESGTNENLTSVDFINRSNGWISCKNGNILYTENGGRNWILYEQNNIPILQSIDFVDSLNGWAVNEGLEVESNDDGAGPPSGYIFHTKDGGKNWEQQVEKYGGFSSVKFLNDKIGWAAGENLWYTRDGGKNWVLQRIPICRINSLDFVDLNTGWLVGFGGAIVHTTNWEVTFIEDPNIKPLNTPKKFILTQNYPNPFNPITRIEFTLPNPEFVTMKVYNILGEEVATLVQDKLHAGNHTYEFHGSNLASGVYLYRIEAGEFQQIRKMVLIK